MWRLQSLKWNKKNNKKPQYTAQDTGKDSRKINIMLFTSLNTVSSIKTNQPEGNILEGTIKISIPATSSWAMMPQWLLSWTAIIAQRELMASYKFIDYFKDLNKCITHQQQHLEEQSVMQLFTTLAWPTFLWVQQQINEMYLLTSFSDTTLCWSDLL